MTRFIIMAPSYNANNGGCIVLHKLCHLLNELGAEAYIAPKIQDRVFGAKKFKGIFRIFKEAYRYRFGKFKTSPVFNTPVFRGDVLDTDIVVYSELVFGNPLNGKHIVRWLLHKPGFFSNEFYYGPGELYFKFDHGLVDNFQHYNSVVSDRLLNVVHVPFEIYNQDDIKDERVGTAYSVRKGKNKVLDQHPEDAICIDGLEHQEIAAIFRKVKRFISYDTYSAYSVFAALCGCEVIVIPDEGVSKEEWYPDEQLRYGLAYGFDDLDSAQQTLHLVKPYRLEQEKRYTESVRHFLDETLDYFQLN